jgi:pescadillo protein
VLIQPSYNGTNPNSLFSNFTIYLSRETPRQPLEFILKSFGCKRVGWDAVLGGGAFTTDELDPSITHQIVDRPPIQASMDEDGDGEDNQTAQKLAANRRVPGRIYIQPQWVWDSANDGELKEPHLYAPGASLPPHLSPFVRKVQGAYDPTMPLEDQEPEHEALEAGDDEEADADETVEGMDVAESGDEDEDEDEEDEDEQDEEDEDEEEEEDHNDALQRQIELEAEMAGKTVQSKTANPKTKAKEDARKALAKKAREEAEDLERAKGMLSKKKRKLFEQMEYTNNKKSAEDAKLRSKRRKVEKEKAGKA